MKKSLLFFILLILITPSVFAETKTTVNVSNSTDSLLENNSQTKTHIEIEVDGEKKVIDTDKPGDYSLSIEKDGGKSSAVVKLNSKTDSSSDSGKENNEVKDSDDEEELAEDIDSAKREIKENKNIVQKIVEEIKDFFENLFGF